MLPLWIQVYPTVTMVVGGSQVTLSNGSYLTIPVGGLADVSVTFQVPAGYTAGNSASLKLITQEIIVSPPGAWVDTLIQYPRLVQRYCGGWSWRQPQGLEQPQQHQVRAQAASGSSSLRSGAWTTDSKELQGAPAFCPWGW